MTRHIARSPAKDHAPWQIGRLAPQLAVDKVGAASQAQGQRRAMTARSAKVQASSLYMRHTMMPPIMPPTKPPWKLMPPSLVAKISSGCAQ